MKIIFLDIDGVLNDGFTILGTGKDFPTMDHLTCLKQIVDATGAEIVLSSSWRFYATYRNDVRNALKKVDLAFIDHTKELKDRATEIEEWLSRHPEAESFVILDDGREPDGKTSLKRLADNLVKTEWELGLLSEHVQQAIDILNKKELAIIKPEDTLSSVEKEV